MSFCDAVITLCVLCWVFSAGCLGAYVSLWMALLVGKLRPEHWTKSECSGWPTPQGGDLATALRRELRLGTHEFDWCNKGKEVALEVAQGLHFLHSSGVIHRCAAVECPLPCEFRAC